MLKPLSAEGRFECGIDDLVQGKAYAFTAVVRQQEAARVEGLGHEAPYGLGVAVANEPGYYPIPAYWCHGDDYQEMSLHASDLNDALKLSPREAALIVCSSMSAQQWRDR